MIDKDEAIRLLRKEVANKGPEFVYVSPVQTPVGEVDQTCFYAYNGEPSCIVGHALVDSGVDIKRLDSCEFVDVSAHALPHHLPNVLDSEAAMIFAAAQQRQDKSISWGESLDAAEITYRVCLVVLSNEQ